MHLKNVLPDAELVLQRLKGGGVTGFSESEIDRMRATFMRHRVPDSQDVHKDDLSNILKHLGYMHVDDAMVAQMAMEVSDYATMEFGDFGNFMSKYAKFEHEKFKEVFNSYDEDGNGVLDGEEIIKFLASLGYTPLRSTVKEAMDLVDLDRSGTLEFEEVVLLMHLYRHSEGFSRDEVSELSHIFQNEDKVKRPGDIEETVPAERLASLLTKFFGPAYADTARKLGAELLARTNAGDSDDEEDQALGLHFSEALVWARRLRDQEFEGYREAFDKFDQDGDSLISQSELKELLVVLGFTLFQPALDEMILQAKVRGDWHDMGSDQTLDYDAFVHFMRLVHETEGFMEHEMEEIRQTFVKFDEDKSKDIDAVELNDMLHYLGYSTKIDEVQRLLGRMDYDPSSTLDFREFVRFMRLHREGELRVTKDAFEKHKNENSVLTEVSARIALRELASADQMALGRQVASQGTATSSSGIDFEALPIGGPLDFEAFVTWAEHCRNQRVVELRKRAGFSEAEINRFQKLFEAHDTSGTGDLNTDEVTRLLINLGFPLRTVEEQQAVVQQLDEARKTAAERGIEGAAEGKISLWVVVQLLRSLYRRDDKQTMNKVTRAAQQCRFQASEVTEFQEVFMSWCDHDSRYADDSVDPETGETVDDSKALSKSSLLRLLRSLGLKIEGKDRSILDSKVMELAEDSKVDFADFLRLMRWMMDTNYCNISRAVSGAV